ncbi:unnamed protein product [Paramecium octaurelia]|uniref:Uncharacterized protein n=1 Tax=Paramecium octaurelia TaxID=43137 RepID=A0A8S1W898_PAROT|nr:unnamed protein product [Paramecium octaurelia]
MQQILLNNFWGGEEWFLLILAVGLIQFKQQNIKDEHFQY